MQRLRAWIAETHGVKAELLRHFLLRFFDSDMPGVGEWRKVAIGIFAALLSISAVVFTTYMRRYNLMMQAGLPADQVLGEMRADQLTFVGLAIAATAVLTALQWQSLFPSLRDCLALAGLPISPRQVFLAKAGALLIMFTVFELAMNAIPSVAFASVTWGRASAGDNFAAMAGGCVFVFFSLLAVQGVLLNLLPARVFERASMLVQAVVFTATIGAVPLVGRQPADAWWWPVNWFVRAGATEHRRMLLAMIVPVVVAAVTYLLSYHRYRRLLVEGGAAASQRERTARLPDLVADPREKAAFAFIWKTLSRSRTHRLILMAYAGLALGWVAKGALDTKPTLNDEGMYGLMVTLAPLGVAILIALGLRYLFSLPVALGANWLFQTTGREGRRAWLAAVERFVVWCGIAPIFVASLPAAFAVLGPVRGAAVMSMSLVAALACFERLYRDWHKVPFTCSYLPGKAPVWLQMLRAGIAFPVLGIGGHLILRSSANLIPFVALFTFELFVWMRLRRRRRAEWDHARLEFEEIEEAPVMSLDLQPASEFEAARPGAAADMFAGTLVASRGFLPQAWREEIETDRSNKRRLVETFLEDVRYGARLIRRSPLFSAVVVATLTIGIGINASVFTIVSALAIRPHVERDPASFLRVVAENRDRGATRPVSYTEYKTWKRDARSVRELAAYSYFMALVGNEEAASVTGLAVSCNFFLVDGIARPTLGRLLDADDCRAPGRIPPAVINETIWRTRFGGDPALIGRTAFVNSRPVTIVGVAPNGASGWAARPPSIWIPLTSQTYFEPGRNVFESEDVLWLHLAGRLAPGYSRSKAEAEFATLARRQDASHPGRHTAITTTNGSWIEELYLSMSGHELMLLGFFAGAFNLVLLISCANVATLLLSRAATRRREIAIRLSLGAPRVRLVRMLVTESLLLAALAGGASLVLARCVPGPLYRAVASKAPEFPMPLDWGTFAYVAAVVLLTGILSGLAPALESVNVNLSGSLKGASSAFGGARLRGVLVAAQVAMSMVLLVEAALFAKSEDQNLRGDPGYRPDRVVVAPLRFPDNTTFEAAAARLRNLERRIAAVPGVHSVSFSDGLPLMEHATVELRPPARADATQPVDIYTGSPRFLETMGVAMLGGREFHDGDFNAVIVSQTLARSFWRVKNPLGQTLDLPGGPVTVVGVSRDVEPLRFGGSENPAIYRVRHAHPTNNFMAVRFDAGAERGAASVRAIIHETYPDMMPIARVLQSWIREVTETLWNVVSFLVVLGLVATALATSGIYGAVSFAVNQRTRELGIRVALGASRLAIVKEVLFAGGKPVAHGLIVGMWLSVAMASGLGQSLQGSPLRLDTTNPALYVAAAALLAMAALAAMVAPARRGANADPLESLRCD